MPQGEKKVVVFVHGWSVSHTKTYGGLPERLHREAAEVGLDIAVREIYLGKYVSFRDEVRLEDISRAFAAAVDRELSDLLQQRRRFACITHSTGGLVIRDWWYRNYATRPRSGTCPMSHLIMLAPANYGSALAPFDSPSFASMRLTSASSGCSWSAAIALKVSSPYETVSPVRPAMT